MKLIRNVDAKKLQLDVLEFFFVVKNFTYR